MTRETSHPYIISSLFKSLKTLITTLSRVLVNDALEHSHFKRLNIENKGLTFPRKRLDK